MALSLPGWRPSVLAAESDVPVIQVDNNYAQGQWFFDPVGLFIQKGQTVRWEGRKWGTTVTAFHPSNENHELRIPENAQPFDSGLLGQTVESTFEWTFDVEGTYDYFCANHPMLGMVGRIVVGTPGGPAEENPPGYGIREGRAPVYPGQAKLLDAIPSQLIVQKGSVRYPRDLLVREYPYAK
jgi:plastocyanin